MHTPDHLVRYVGVNCWQKIALAEDALLEDPLILVDRSALKCRRKRHAYGDGLDPGMLGGLPSYDGGIVAVPVFELDHGPSVDRTVLQEQ